MRIGTRKDGDVTLSRLPILTRGELMKQVGSEKSLLVAGDQLTVRSHSTSGSSGMPVRFFTSEMNSRYNEIRSLAQYFLEGRDLTLNRTRLKYVHRDDKNKFTTQKADSWHDALGSLFRLGAKKHIEYFRASMLLLRKELERDPIGYLIATPWTVEALLQYMDPAAFKRAEMAMWIPTGAAVDPTLREAFTSHGIPVRAIY